MVKANEQENPANEKDEMGCRGEGVVRVSLSSRRKRESKGRASHRLFFVELKSRVELDSTLLDLTQTRF
jgi:hypothetical protein